MKHRLTHPGRLLAAVLLAAAACARQPASSPPPGLVGPALPPAWDLTVRQAGERHGDANGEGNGGHLDVRAPEPLPLGTGPAWDLDVKSYETEERVQHFVAHFSGRASARLSDRLSEGTRYERMIRSRFREAGLPEDLYYLALVESGYNPHAYSRAAAVGMWQFMTTTARGMGLRVDWWVDERRDPVRSTEAAVRFLGGLNEQFGSLYLAAAAYNGGPGRIARGLSRYEEDLDGLDGDDLFFALAAKNYLRNETRDYVPQLIAAAIVAKEPERHGLAIAERPAFEFDSAEVGPLMPLAAAARAAGTTVREIQRLNPHVLRGMTPPRGSFFIRIPSGSRARFDSAFAAMPADERIGARVITTRTSTSWAALARPERLSARTLAAFNPRTRSSRKSGAIPAGTQILVPTPATAQAALPVPDPAIERYGGGARTYVVRKGDNLTLIARRYRTTPAALMRLNRLKKPLIFPGQELRVRS